MKVVAGITEELKARDQMKWGGLINNVRSSAEKIVLQERTCVQKCQNKYENKVVKVAKSTKYN